MIGKQMTWLSKIIVRSSKKYWEFYYKQKLKYFSDQ